MSLLLEELAAVSSQSHFNSQQSTSIQDLKEPILQQQPSGSPINQAAIRADPTIFISLPSYRDAELQPTIADILQKAKFPHLLTLAINQQLSDEDLSVLDIRNTLSNLAIWEPLEATMNARIKMLHSKPFPIKLNDYRHRKTQALVKVLTMSSDHATGPMPARAYIEQCLYSDQRFVMHMDSHMCMVPHFDQLVIEQFDKAADYQQYQNQLVAGGAPPSALSNFDSSMVLDINDLPKIVLTCYPYDYVPNRNIALRKPDAAIEKRPPSYLGFKTMHPVTICKIDLSARDHVSTVDPVTGDVSTIATVPTISQSGALTGSAPKAPVANVLGYRPRSDKHELAASSIKYNAFGSKNNAMGPSVAGKPGNLAVSNATMIRRASSSSSSSTAAAKNAILNVPQQDRLMYTRHPPVSAPLLPSAFWAACFSFGPASMLSLCPYDPYCSYVFIGEEYSMALRLYSHGFRLYAPNIHICYHLTTREYRPTYWEQFHEKTMYDLHATTKHSITAAGGGGGAATATAVYSPFAGGPTSFATSIGVGGSTSTGMIRRQQHSNTPATNSSAVGRAINAPPLKAPKLTQQQRIERKYLEQQGYTRLYDLIINGNSQLYVPKNKSAVGLQSKTTFVPAADDGVMTLELDEEDAKHPKYSLGPYATLADFQLFSGVYVDQQKYERRSTLGLTPHYKGTPEEMYKQPLITNVSPQQHQQQQMSMLQRR